MKFDLLIAGKKIEGITSVKYKEDNNYQYEFYQRLKNKLYLRNFNNKIVLELTDDQLNNFISSGVKKGSKINIDIEHN